MSILPQFGLLVVVTIIQRYMLGSIILRRVISPAGVRYLLLSVINKFQQKEPSLNDSKRPLGRLLSSKKFLPIRYPGKSKRNNLKMWQVDLTEEITSSMKKGELRKADETSKSVGRKTTTVENNTHQGRSTIFLNFGTW